MKKGLILLVVAAVAIAWFGRGSSDEQDARHHGTALFDRIWIEKMPTSPKEKIDVFVALREVAHYGAFERVSAYEGKYSVFEWKAKKDGVLNVHMLQRDKTAKVSYKVSHEGCGEFDYCLELKGAPMGGKKYGSMKGWEIDSTEPAAIRARVFDAVK